MKKQLTVLSISILLITGTAFKALAQKKEKKNNNKEHQHDHGNPGKGNKAKSKDNGGHSNKIEHKESNGKNDTKTFKVRNNKNGNKGKKDEINITRNIVTQSKNGYSWNNGNFKNRKEIKNKEKVTICHKFNNGDEPAVTIRVSSNALKAHMAHGDVVGGCPAVTTGRFSDIFLKKRNTYYSELQDNQEQVLYSRSILDYALIKLTNSRLQLVTLQSNNVPQVEIDRKQATVVELEQNVSLLQTLIGVAVNLAVNKIQQ